MDRFDRGDRAYALADAIQVGRLDAALGGEMDDVAGGLFYFGGAGSLAHMADVLEEGRADAVLAASIFHFGTYTVGDVKQFLASRNIPVRLI